MAARSPKPPEVHAPDPSLASQAIHGDWICECEHVNPSSGVVCKECRNPRPGSTQAQLKVENDVQEALKKMKKQEEEGKDLKTLKKQEKEGKDLKKLKKQEEEGKDSKKMKKQEEKGKDSKNLKKQEEEGKDFKKLKKQEEEGKDLKKLKKQEEDGKDLEMKKQEEEGKDLKKQEKEGEDLKKMKNQEKEGKDLKQEKGGKDLKKMKKQEEEGRKRSSGISGDQGSPRNSVDQESISRERIESILQDEKRTNSESDREVRMANTKEVNQHWQAGNKELKKGKVGKAIQLYTDALNLMIDDTYKDPSIADIYNSRSNAFFVEQQYNEALKDANEVVKHDPTNVKILYRIVRCCIILGETKMGKDCLSKIPKGTGDAKELKSFTEKFDRLEELKEGASKCYEMKKYYDALGKTEEAIGISPGAVFFIMMKAKCLAYQQRVDEALQLLQGRQADSHVQFVRGLYHYYNNNLEMAASAFKDAKKCIPEAASWLDQTNALKNADLTVMDVKRYGGGDIFSQATNLIPAILNNRASSKIADEDFKGGLEDASKILKIAPGHDKAASKIVHCHLALGNIKEAEASLKLIADLSTRKSYVDKLKKLEDQQILALDFMNRGQYAAAEETLISACKTSPKSFNLVLMHAECLAMQGKISDAYKILPNLLRNPDKNDEASVNPNFLFVQGVCYYYKNQLDAAKTKFIEARVLALKNKLKYCKVLNKAVLFQQKSTDMEKAFEDANNEKKGGHKVKALEHCNAALAIDPKNKEYMLQVHLFRAELNADIGNYVAAANDYESVIKIEPKCYNAWMNRGKLHMKNDSFEEAVNDFERAYELRATQESRTNLKTAKKKLRTEEKLNYYDILGISRDANEEDIKKAYHKKAKEFHPDKHMSADEDERLKMESKMKEISVAQRCLSDPIQKRRYDVKLDRDEDSDYEDISSDDDDCGDHFSHFNVFEFFMQDMFQDFMRSRSRRGGGGRYSHFYY